MQTIQVTVIRKVNAYNTKTTGKENLSSARDDVSRAHPPSLPSPLVLLPMPVILAASAAVSVVVERVDVALLVVVAVMWQPVVLGVVVTTSG